MDSAVLLAADGPPLRVAAKALHPLEAGGQLADTAAPTPTASGTLEDWQVVTLAEIQTALSAAAAASGLPESPRSANEGGEQRVPLPATPSKARHVRSRRGRPKSGASRSSAAGDGAEADAEAPLAGQKGNNGRADPLPGASAKPSGIRAWNPFAGFGPKLMGPRHKAGAHILDLAPPLSPSTHSKPATGKAKGQEASTAPAAPMAAVAAAPQAEPAATPAPTLADSTPDIDAAAANAGCSPAGTTTKSEEAPAPDYDTAKECSGMVGKGMSASSVAGSKLGPKGATADTSTSSGGSAGGVCAAGDSNSSKAVGSGNGSGKLPAAASDYSLPKGKAKKGKKKRSRK